MALRVLVIDDDDLSREVFALMLNSAGYAVETADSGDVALSRLQAGGVIPEVVLTDLQMPGTTGSELATQLRALCGPTTKLLAMSASAPDQEMDDAFDCLLLKPFTAETFAAATASASPPAAMKSAAPTGSALDPTSLDPTSLDQTSLDQTICDKLAASMKPAQLNKLYDLCLADTDKRLAVMRQAASDGDDPTYKREAHAIKGSCGMVGAVELQTLATSMEKHGLSGDHVASLKEFIVACERLKGMLIAREIIN
jgi:CheY-like chemotaxis protein